MTFPSGFQRRPLLNMQAIWLPSNTISAFMWAFEREALQNSLELQHVCGDSVGERNSRIIKSKFIFEEPLGDRMVILASQSFQH